MTKITHLQDTTYISRLGVLDEIPEKPSLRLLKVKCWKAKLFLCLLDQNGKGQNMGYMNLEVFGITWV